MIVYTTDNMREFILSYTFPLYPGIQGGPLLHYVKCGGKDAMFRED